MRFRELDNAFVHVRTGRELITKHSPVTVADAGLSGTGLTACPSVANMERPHGTSLRVCRSLMNAEANGQTHLRSNSCGVLPGIEQMFG